MLYVYEGCCGNTSIERRCRLVEYEADPSYSCPKCGKALKQWITAPRLSLKTKSFEPFRSPVDGSIITSESSLREHNRRNDVVNVHEGYTEAAYLNKVNEDLFAGINKEASKDISAEVHQSINMLNNGHVPEVAPEGDVV